MPYVTRQEADDYYQERKKAMSWEIKHREDWTPAGDKAIVLIIAENKYKMDGQPHVAKLLASTVIIEVTDTMADGSADLIGRNTKISISGTDQPEKFMLDVDPLLFNAAPKRQQSWNIKKAIKSLINTSKTTEEKREGVRTIRLSATKKDKRDDYQEEDKKTLL